MSTRLSLGMVAAVMLASAGLAISCSSGSRQANTGSNATGATAQCDLNNPHAASNPTPPVPLATPPAATNAHAESHALHNVHRIGSKMISGAVPEGAPAFDELKAMGVKTVISVDGATPDVGAAELRGMRYVHIPITYAEATKEQQLELARAVRDLPGPIYIHCHHGKHRSPAAAAAVAVALGESSPEDAVAFMKTAGTAANYKGLYACVANAVVATTAILDGAPATFPSVRTPQGITEAMVGVDECYEHLGFINAAGWQVPNDHPDLVPAAEAGRLADHLRLSGEDPKVKALGAAFTRRLADATATATALEELIVANAPKNKLDGKWKLVVASCKDCHAVYRDVKW
jgi:protein tyrosine phosphatase (PTP) superfamily phosphohydrolase (DUF442 family)